MRVRMVMSMIMTVIMVVVVGMIVIVAVAVAVPIDGADAFYVMVMAFLWKPYLVFKAQYLFAIFTLLAVHIGVAGKDIAHAFRKRIQHQGMIV